ncbi:MAG: glycerol dehydratase reactivase beta/small subunit family protein [Gaiellales bacterium]
MGRAEEPPTVVALLADVSGRSQLEAGFEEESVPLEVQRIGGGERLELAREAARRSRLGLGIGSDGGGLALVLAAAPARAYFEAPPSAARAFGHAAARVAARRPLRPAHPGAADAEVTAGEAR